MARADAESRRLVGSGTEGVDCQDGLVGSGGKLLAAVSAFMCRHRSCLWRLGSNWARVGP
jgi:hypothetical protein